jgi:hypothetical protein
VDANQAIAVGILDPALLSFTNEADLNMENLLTVRNISA